jgi:hypothetical protein
MLVNGHPAIRFVWVSAKFVICTVESVNGTLVAAKCAHSPLDQRIIALLRNIALYVTDRLICPADSLARHHFSTPKSSTITVLGELCREGEACPQSRQSAKRFSSHWNWDSPTPLAAGECAPPPFGPGGGHTRLRLKGWGSPNSNEGTYTVVLYIYKYFVSLPSHSDYSIWLAVHLLRAHNSRSGGHKIGSLVWRQLAALTKCVKISLGSGLSTILSI